MMHIIHIHYQKPIEQVEKYLIEHRLFLDQGYNKGLFLASGPLKPRTGGVIVATGDLEKIKKLLSQDPYYINNIATYEFMSFNPVKHNEILKQWLK